MLSTLPSHSNSCCKGAPDVQVEPLNVRTSPCVPGILKLEARTAVPWNVSA